MLDACPNNRMSEAEIYNNFYEGMTPECKDLVNSASRGDFSRLRVSEAKRILSRLIDAKKAYDSPRTTLLRRGTVNAASEQPEDRMEARMDKLEKAIISALEKTKQATPTEKCQAPLGPEESYQLYNPLTEGEYPAQVYAAGSWNANGSWNPGKQRDAPWRDHPNFRWSDADLNQPAPQTQNFPNRGEGPSSWASRNSEGTHQLGNRGPNGNTNWSSGNQPNWSGRYQQENPADSYIPPQQRGFQGQGYNHYQNQRGNSHFNQGHGYNQSASGSDQPFQRPQQGHIDNYSGDLLNNDVVNKLQDTQNEQKAALDMLARQLSQISTSISEMRGNEGKIPATVKMPGKENISSVDLRPNEEQVRPQGPLEKEKSSGGIGQLIKETEEVGVHKKPEEAASEEGRETKETEEVPNEVKENISMIATKQRVPTKHSDPGMFTLPISIGNNEVIRAMCDLGASINVLPLSIYQTLNGVKMVDAQVAIQLADCSCIHQEGIVENIIVKVHDFIYEADFYVIRTGTNSAGSSRILLGQPFLKIARTVINVFDGTLCLEYYGKKYTLRMEEAQKPTDMENLHSVEDIAPPEYEYNMEDLLQEECREVGGGMEKEVAKWNQEVHTQGLTDQEIDEVIMDFCLGPQATWSSGVIHSQVEDFKSGKIQEKEKRPLPQVVSPIGKRSKRVSPCPIRFHQINGRENLSEEEGLNCKNEEIRTDAHIYKNKSSRTVVHNSTSQLSQTLQQTDSNIPGTLASPNSQILKKAMASQNNPESTKPPPPPHTGRDSGRSDGRGRDHNGGGGGRQFRGAPHGEPIAEASVELIEVPTESAEEDAGLTPAELEMLAEQASEEKEQARNEAEKDAGHGEKPSREGMEIRAEEGRGFVPLIRRPRSGRQTMPRKPTPAPTEGTSLKDVQTPHLEEIPTRGPGADEEAGGSRKKRKGKQPAEPESKKKRVLLDEASGEATDAEKEVKAERNLAEPSYKKFLVNLDSDMLQRMITFDDEVTQEEFIARLAGGRTTKSGKRIDQNSLQFLTADAKLLEYISGIGFD
ncbi:hypothetical protein AAHA92_31503 [Salvia divinorum]|uniref:Peptidase A2 domain-containing protein n=1 Tax=Salvia divinorum TaxID=28513 RepID=A0ABD1FR09_SALDI